MGDFGLTCNDTTGGDTGRQDEEGEGGIHLEHMLGLQREDGVKRGKKETSHFLLFTTPSVSKESLWESC
jgi:hypothetical protein